MKPLEFVSALGGGIWHTTSSARYQDILKTNSILPEPDIPDSERWSTKAGAEYYPYVRSLGGVSLFDFQGFDPKSYDAKYPGWNWCEFVPFRRQWGSAIWLEIDRNKIIDSFISAEDLLNRWRKESSVRRILPLLEAAHIGPIPIASVSRVLAVNKDGYEEIATA